MFFAALLLASSFTFSQNNGTMIAGKDSWTFTLQNANVGDKLEVVAHKNGVNLGRFLICEVQSGSSCSASTTPGAQDIGLWAGNVLINDIKSGDFMVWVTENDSCSIPPWIIIQGAKYPCWTLERVKSEYREAEANVEFSRWLVNAPFSRSELEDYSAIFPKLTIIEHPDAFMSNGSPAAGVYKAVGLHAVGWDHIEYSLKHETTVLPMVLMHELGHKRELDEERKRNPLNAFLTFGWWHFGHGDFLDPQVKSTNHVKDWFYRRVPKYLSYYPGQIGHEPVKGTPGSLPPIFPPVLVKKQFELFSNFEYHMEQHPEHE